MTDTKIFEMVESLLREEGFTRISKSHSAHSATVSAEKGAQRLVMHMTDQAELPQHSRRSEGVPASEIKLSARLAGLAPNAAGQVLQRSGGGSALSTADRAKRHR